MTEAPAHDVVFSRYERQQRILDLMIAIPGLLAAVPVLLVVAIAIRVSSPGAVFFLQDRVGRGGRTFKVLKFRTMRTGSATIHSAVSTRSDPRITPVGAVLRRTKLDELPQLLNVVTGEMSLVGPRPDVAEVVATYSAEMREILRLRPGITGVASLLFADEEVLLERSSAPADDYLEVVVPAKVAIGLASLKRCSIAEDFRVLLGTVLSRRIAQPLVARVGPYRTQVESEIGRRQEARSPQTLTNNTPKDRVERWT